jgi:hypothetical protein
MNSRENQPNDNIACPALPNFAGADARCYAKR